MTTEADLRREQVLAALVQAGGSGLSGQALADELGCSRAAVHRHVEALRRSGVPVDGVHEGYRLGDGADPVVPSLVASALAAPIGGPVRWSAETGSTNDDAVSAARDGAPEGLVIGADVQRAGRGRRGRPWQTNPGDALLFSIVLRPAVPATDVGVIPVVAAVAVAEAIGDDVRIIWPNDLVVDGRKVCGILCELAADESGVSWVVVGIGVNVRGVPTLTDARWTPGALADGTRAPRRADLLVAILQAFSARYSEWREHGPAAALGAFAARDELAGRGLTAQVGDHEIVGTASGLDEAGHLRVVTATGEVALASGEVTRVERD